MASRFEIIGNYLTITDTVSGDIQYKAHSKNSDYIEEDLRNNIVRIVDAKSINEEQAIEFSDSLSNCIDSLDVPFTEASFRTFVFNELGKSNPGTSGTSTLLENTGLDALEALIAFGKSGGGGLAQDSNLYWDNANKRLGIGTSISGASRLYVLISDTDNVEGFIVTNNDSTNNTNHIVINGTSGGQALLINTGVGSLENGIAFGDGDSGIYELGDDFLSIYLAGLNAYSVTTSAFSATFAGSFYLSRSVATANLPGFSFLGDTNTGIGRAADDQLSLISGGIEGIRVIENNSMIQIDMKGRVNNSKGADVVSANDITLGNGGNYFDITGTTQINTISATGWTAGALITLQFDSSVIVAHNTAGTGASILLAGSINFGATSNDTLSLRYDGVTWREVSRTVI